MTRQYRHENLVPAQNFQAVAYPVDVQLILKANQPLADMLKGKGEQQGDAAQAETPESPSVVIPAQIQLFNIPGCR